MTVAPIDLPIDDQDARRIKRGEAQLEKGLGRTKRRLTSRWATAVALIIAIAWTIPTFGLFISSFRPAQLIQTTGWWTIFQN